MIVRECSGVKQYSDPLTICRVLIIDDEVAIRECTTELVLTILDNIPASIHQLADGSELEECLDDLGVGSPIHLIIMDMDMPKRDGLATYLKLIEYPEYEKTPVIFHSGGFRTIDMEELKQDWKEENIAFIQKGTPTYVGELIGAIKTFLEI